MDWVSGLPLRKRSLWSGWESRCDLQQLCRCKFSSVFSPSTFNISCSSCSLSVTPSAAFCPSTFYIWLITILLIRKQKPRGQQQNVQVSTALAVSKSTFLLVIMLMIWLIKFLFVNQNNDINLRYHWVLHLLGLDPDKTVLPTSLEDVGWEMKDSWNTIWLYTDFKSDVSSTSISILEVHILAICCPYLIRLLAAVWLFYVYISMFCRTCFNS